jgi:hypothetical protein
MCRINRIIQKKPPPLYPVNPVYPCLNLSMGSGFARDPHFSGGNGAIDALLLHSLQGKLAK